MGDLIKRWAALLLCVCLAAAAPVDALAATKPINSVNVKVSSNLKAGNTLPDIQTGKKPLICASNEPSAVLARAFGECRGSQQPAGLLT